MNNKYDLVSIVIPSRNNLKYVKSAYSSIRSNIVEKHEVILLDDASDDGTWEWFQEIKKIDSNVKIFRNEGSERVGHCVLYDIGAELASHEIFTIFHADMIASPNYIKNLLKNIDVGVVVSATRIEPPLHPGGPEKIVSYFGTEPEDFRNERFLESASELEVTHNGKTTEGIFAPWCMYVKDFLSIGGHDKKLFAPMELEDSDLFNRFFLKGYKLIQARDSFVYHFTCRGSRFKDGVDIERVIDLPDGTKWYKPKDSQEYLKLRQIKFKEWWRKWHSDVLHDVNLKPIVNPRYDIGIRINNCRPQLFELLEPWCDNISTDMSCGWGDYVSKEQKNSSFNILSKVTIGELSNDIIIEFDGTKFIRQDQFDFIKNISLIVEEVGEFEHDIFKIEVKKLEDNKNKLINNQDFYSWKNIL